MSVLLVTDDVDDDILKQTKHSCQDEFYKQLKRLEYDLSGTSFSILESSSSIIVKSNQYYRKNRRRRHCRLQACLVQPLLTYMCIFLFLIQHVHWPLIILSLSSMNIISVQASTSAMTKTNTLLSSNQMDPHSRTSPPTISADKEKENEQRCLPIQHSHIDRICSKTCRARRTPFEHYDNVNISQIFSDIFHLPFCSRYLLNQAINNTNLFNEINESKCRQILNQIINYDEEAQKASQFFATYMESIDSASEENRYSIIKSDCQEAYRGWACSVNIPFYYRDQRIPPCQSICDEVERVCPTFRPSDREPLFAGQPLFFCDGSIVANSDYGQRPHCFDTCHLSGGSLQRHSVSSSSFHSISSVATFAEDLLTTPPCFEIEPIAYSRFNSISFSLPFDNGSMFDSLTNRSLTSSTQTLHSLSLSPCWFTLLVVLFR